VLNREWLDEVVTGARFVGDLPRFLRRPITRPEALAILERRLAARESDFLVLMQRAVWERPDSPYRALLAAAGCGPGDLTSLVQRDGLESALLALAARGVYLTVDEMKGRRPAVRGSVTIHVDPRGLRNPALGGHLTSRTSGGGGPSMAIPFDLASMRDRAVNYALFLEARGGAGWRKAIWGVPGRSVGSAARHSAFGQPLERLFLLVDPGAVGLHPRYRWSLLGLRLAGWLAGRPQPAPEVVSLADPTPVARWMNRVVREGGVPYCFTFVSAALRLGQAAEAAGLDLGGGQLTVTGEPITAVRLALIRRAGLAALPDYGSGECGGSIAYGCLAPAAPDDVHFLHDLHALIRVDGSTGVPALPEGALLMTSLRATAPLVMLNVSMGDRAELTEGGCGCPLEQLGWRTHLHTIRSFEKLTAGGMTVLDGEALRILEEVLPARFGGGPSDYQLVEETGPDGLPRLRLLVEPLLGPLDEHAIKERFLEGLGRGSGAKRVMMLQWRSGDFLRVERSSPRVIGGGKILHLIREAQVRTDQTRRPAGRT
jgi:hypothetical protein